MNDSVVRELVRAAKRRGIRPEALCALVEVETAGIPFENDNNTPACCTTAHCLSGGPEEGVLNQFVNAGLAIPKWNKATQNKDQGSSAKRIALITRARAIDENVANRRLPGASARPWASWRKSRASLTRPRWSIA